jgi:hypothetical protein
VIVGDADSTGKFRRHAKFRYSRLFRQRLPVWRFDTARRGERFYWQMSLFSRFLWPLVGMPETMKNFAGTEPSAAWGV